MDRLDKDGNKSQPGILRVESVGSNTPAPGKSISEDAVLNLPERGLFGVFDGVGAVARPADSSRLASQTVEEMLADPVPMSESEEIERLKSALVLAHENILKEQGNNLHLGSMATTGTICRTIVNEKNEKMLVYAHVGDCRIVILRYDGGIEHVTSDESDGNLLYNVLGSQAGFLGVKQAGSVKLSKNDRVVICSDGITGDWEEQLLSDQEYASALDRSHDLQEVMENLIKTSKKPDDKGAVVLEVS